MPFRPTFDCLWCGTAWVTRGPDDLEGYAQLCPDCVGRAGENGFLRFRLKAAIDERARATSSTAALASDDRTSHPAGATATSVATERSVATATSEAAHSPVAAPDAGPATVRDGLDAEMVAYYTARAGEYDDWYLRRGRYAHGPVHDQAWNAELDAATLWLDGLPLSGEIVELAAGTGWWSPLLASKGELSIYDAAEPPLDLARERLVAHGLRAHIHVRDAWAEPDRTVDAVFAGFWLGHVQRARLGAFLGLVRRWLKPGGTFVFIDSRTDPSSGAVDQPPTTEEERTAGIARRSVTDGREFRVVKVLYEPDELEAALLAAGFSVAEVATTARFFVLGRATA
jgi:demethylmenaquinone methyltransferase/2-methoxy-6-polyprenyl-1,4-benzoquinol methylase